MRARDARLGRPVLSVVVLLAAAGFLSCGGAGPTDPVRGPDQPPVGEGSSVAERPGPHAPTEAAELSSEEVDTLFGSEISGIMERRRSVVRTPSAWADAWAEITGPMISAEPVPEVDFTTRQVLVLAMGGRPSGGYSIRLGALSQLGDTLYAVVRETSPAAGCLTSQALTQPVAVLAVPLHGVRVEFVEERALLDC